MSIRLEYWRLAPEEFKSLLSLQLRLKAGMDPRVFELVGLRVSQINGCAFCVDLHASELRKTQETERRINALVAWRNTPFYSESERAALEWAERLTELDGSAAREAAYEALRPHFSDRETVILVLAIAVMNAMNRLAIGCGRRPEPEAVRAAPEAVRAAPAAVQAAPNAGREPC